MVIRLQFSKDTGMVLNDAVFSPDGQKVLTGS